MSKRSLEEQEKLLAYTRHFLATAIEHRDALKRQLKNQEKAVLKWQRELATLESEPGHAEATE